MISMTGYGKANLSKDAYDIEIEIKSVNAKFLDLKSYIPKEVNHLEPLLRTMVNKYYKRGTIELRLRYTDRSEPQIKLNEEKLHYFSDVMHKIMTVCKTDCMPLEYILREYDIIEYKNTLSENKAFAEDVVSAFKLAVKNQQSMAKKEGASIKKHITASIVHINNAVDAIASTLPQFKKELFDKMKQRILEILPQSTNINLEQRLMQELAIYLDRYDIHEEINRLKEHLDTLQTTMSSRAANDIGKTLNFIFQEMQRESNTLGSKYSNHLSFRHVLLIKEEIEKCREIIQNVM